MCLLIAPSFITPRATRLKTSVFDYGCAVLTFLRATHDQLTCPKTDFIGPEICGQFYFYWDKDIFVATAAAAVAVVKMDRTVDTTSEDYQKP